MGPLGALSGAVPPSRGSGVASVAAVADRAPQSEAARLARTAKQLEGVFVQQLYKAMRDTVPEDGIARGGAGEDTFTSLMDQHIAEQTPGKWHHGLAGAIERVLTGRIEQGRHP